MVLIVLGSYGMVHSALDLADAWSVPKALVGILVLAALTSLPNAFTAVRLGIHRRGEALVSETLNSNTINLGAGVVFPALIIGLGSTSGVGFELAWLLAMTLAAVALLATRRGSGRIGGMVLIAMYLVFVGVQLGL